MNAESNYSCGVKVLQLLSGINGALKRVIEWRVAGSNEHVQGNVKYLNI